MKQSYGFFITLWLALAVSMHPANASESPILVVNGTQRMIPVSSIARLAPMQRTGLAISFSRQGKPLSAMVDNLFYHTGEYGYEFSAAPFEYGGEVYFPEEVLPHLGIQITVGKQTATLRRPDEKSARPVSCALRNIPLPAGEAKGLYPIVDFASSCLLGGLWNGKWHPAEEIEHKITGKEHYRGYALDKPLGILPGGEVRENEGGGGVFLASLKTAYAIGITGGWNALPRSPRVQNTRQAVYLQEVERIAAAHGIAKAHGAHLRQLLRIDLDGDKVDEVLFCAMNVKDAKQHEESTTFYAVTDAGGKELVAFGKDATGDHVGQYALAGVRKIIDGQVRTQILAGIFHTPDLSGPRLPREYEIAGVLDLDGDGQQEILVRETMMLQMRIRIFKYAEGRFWEVLSGGWCE